MDVTKVRVSLHDDAKLKAFVTIVLDHSFEIRGLKVIFGNNGLFVAMPSRRKPDGTFQDIAHPTSREAREHIEDAVMRAYCDSIHGDDAAGLFAKLKPPPPNLFGAMRLSLETGEPT
jgi:stage V sporulation protein G